MPFYISFLDLFEEAKGPIRSHFDFDTLFKNHIWPHHPVENVIDNVSMDCLDIRDQGQARPTDAHWPIFVGSCGYVGLFLWRHKGFKLWTFSAP